MSKKKKKKESLGRKTVTHPFVVNFPQLDEARSYKGGAAVFQIEMLFDKDIDLDEPADGQDYSLNEIVRNAAIEEFGDDEDDWPELEMPVKDGDTEKTKRGKPGYKGRMYVKAKNKNQPGVVDHNLKQILDIKKEIYSGCLCRAEVFAFAYQDNPGNGVSLILQNLQKVGEGKRIDNQNDPEDVFSVVKKKKKPKDEEPEEEDSDDEDDDEDEPKKKKAKKSRDDDDEEEDDEPKKKKSTPVKNKKKIDDDDDEELIEDDEEEEKPKKKKKK